MTGWVTGQRTWNPVWVKEDSIPWQSSSQRCTADHYGASMQTYAIPSSGRRWSVSLERAAGILLSIQVSLGGDSWLSYCMTVPAVISPQISDDVE
ncbi:hypothetical protein DNTS_000001 [Danionella cerebrum]|uniref:Uncharacterized protein n=1 Tax=Danionella cerebrum TaxID=2873325 RepID=A0A553QIJ3_9TELE|nr:hypothetical protein DNTS_000001 [Danionella translucida]